MAHAICKMVDLLLIILRQQILQNLKVNGSIFKHCKFILMNDIYLRKFDLIIKIYNLFILWNYQIEPKEYNKLMLKA